MFASVRSDEQNMAGPGHGQSVAFSACFVSVSACFGNGPDTTNSAAPGFDEAHSERPMLDADR